RPIPRDFCRQRLSERPDVSLGHEFHETVPTLRRNVLLNSPKPLHKSANVVISVLIVVDCFDNLFRSSGWFGRRVFSEVSRLPEVFQQCSVKTIVNAKVGFVKLLAFPC